MDGLILINKSLGCTSHDVVQSLRRLLHVKKIGHFGTLDPMAEGLLLIGVGKATRLFPFLSRTEKVYTGSIMLGESTDTYDAEGKITFRHEGPLPEKIHLEKAMEYFVGDFAQVPPPYSAKKFKGRPLYAHARNNRPVPLKPNPVTVFYFLLEKYSPPLIRFQVKCSSGTYIRSMAHDLGQKLGCGARLDTLKRTEVGPYSLLDSHNLEEIEEMATQGMIHTCVLPMSSLLPEYPQLILDDERIQLVVHGNPVPLRQFENPAPQPDDETCIYRIFDREGNLIALGKTIKESGEIHPFTVFTTK
jgi:tRNA pseudouridine55 synthase